MMVSSLNRINQIGLGYLVEYSYWTTVVRHYLKA